MLLVTLGLYSASYKAFMALSLKFVALILFVSSAVLYVGLPGAQIGSHQTHLQQNNASYVDEPLDQLLQTIPEIKTLQPAQDQTQLAMILEHSGKNVEMEFRNFSDLVAKEIVSEIRANPTTDPSGLPKINPNEPNLFQDEYSYFIVREGTLVQTRIREYRRDRYGSDGAKPITSPSLATVPGMTFLSANFASSLLYFSSDLQGEERFRYLGEQRVGVRTAYVVAFAQVPGVATVSIPMRMTNAMGRTGKGEPLLSIFTYPCLTKLGLHSSECPPHAILVRAKVAEQHGVGFPTANPHDFRMGYAAAICFAGERPT
jgi:hypothetical protein